ncbi:hypothetical protein [Amycolatopsis sp.]|jgi:hypothetical protein|uniref:hypothetical protein n=1 Tax=Amycolatopsis sp. TaxID=37632 RepID=UPI002E0395A5|nr:hypothetical protein [Amycolatopsis sp.]
MPEPILISISAALAAKTIVGLVDLVRRKFAKDPAATAALEAAQAAPEDPKAVQALAEHLDTTEKSDENFATALRSEWEKASVSQQAKSGKVVNQISGDVSGKVVQAGDIHGDISF